MKKITVGVIYGGRSAERKISIVSGAEVLKNIDRKKYNVVPIEIASDGITWKIKGSASTNYTTLISKHKLDLIFIALHGPFGEDGTIQGLLELLGIPYTGSGILASALGMDKQKFKLFIEKVGLNTPRGFLQKDGQKLPKIDFPIFIKPNRNGSSVGAHIAKNKKELKKALKDALIYDSEILVEEYIKGTEITCAIVGNEKPVALPLVEIVSKNDFFDYESKYNPKLSEEICPARINKKMAQKATENALKAYKAIGCRGFGRVDMIIKGQKIYILEINTIPGLTAVSLLPKAAKTAEISYQELLEKVITLARS